MKVHDLENHVTTVKQEMKTEVIPFESEYVNHSNLSICSEEVAQEVTSIREEKTNREVVSDRLTAPINKNFKRGRSAPALEDKIVKVLENRTETIPFDTQYIENECLYIGESLVILEGVKGEVNIVEKVAIVNGEETDRKVVLKDITIEPVSAVVHTGRKALLIHQIPLIAKERAFSSKSTSADYIDQVKVKKTAAKKPYTNKINNNVSATSALSKNRIIRSNVPSILSSVFTALKEILTLFKIKNN